MSFVLTIRPERWRAQYVFKTFAPAERTVGEVTTCMFRMNEKPKLIEKEPYRWVSQDYSSGYRDHLAEVWEVPIDAPDALTRPVDLGKIHGWEYVIPWTTGSEFVFYKLETAIESVRITYSDHHMQINNDWHLHTRLTSDRTETRQHSGGSYQHRPSKTIEKRLRRMEIVDMLHRPVNLDNYKSVNYQAPHKVFE